MSLIDRLKEAQPSLLRRLKYEIGQRNEQSARTGNEAQGVYQVGGMGEYQVPANGQTGITR